MRRYLGDSDEWLTDAYRQKTILTNWILAVSKTIEKWLNRKLEIESRTEYFDITYNRVQYYVKAIPIVSITSVYSDSSGEFDGDEDEESDYHVGENSRSVVLDYNFSYTAKRGLRIIYTGGLAYHGTRSEYAVSSLVNSFTAGNYVVGETSDAEGIVRSASSTSITVEVIRGVFEAGETLTEYTGEGSDGASGTSAVLSSKTTECLAETYPDIVRAAEIQVRYMWKYADSFELSDTSRDGTSRKRPEYKLGKPVTPEAAMILTSYRIPSL